MATGNSAGAAALFMDTWGWGTISNPEEIGHQKVKEILWNLPKSGTHLVTTNLVLAETYTLVRFRIHHQAALELHKKVEALISTRLLKVIYVTNELEQAAWKIFERYSDKNFSFTDCTSFVTMQILMIRQVITGDQHFKQMGYLVLPEVS